MRLHTIAVAASLALGSATAVAQTPAMPNASPSQADMLKMMHLAGRNQLGVLEFCQAQGFIGADVIALQKRMLGMLPPAQVEGLDAAEATGKRGVVAFGGNEIPIADAAKAQNTTGEALCKQMGSMLQANAANLPK